MNVFSIVFCPSLTVSPTKNIFPSKCIAPQSDQKVMEMLMGVKCKLKCIYEIGYSFFLLSCFFENTTEILQTQHMNIYNFVQTH